ncbi:modifier of mdg4-like isoform X2 [Malaya genurostris]|uniref:modifier of mdg4-like isoform X2 n=1 Tax=Malaya genurostris TaxID=325434 RepID=UPI0026F3BA8C|nr:modifier of mdg4-like isoform X2 [Malaya genurostris]
MADDEQFSLCWNNFNTNLSAGFHESLIRGDLVDVTLAAEGQLVKAHRLILSVCSPYFRKMFTQMPANQHAFIFLKDVSHSALKDLIQFMYCGEVNVKQDALPAFISTAEALQIKGLTETGESAPTQPSPAKETSHIPSSGMTSIPSTASSPRVKTLQRSRIHSYKLDSDDGSDHEKVVQITATSTPAPASSSSSGPSATIVATQIAAPQQVQILQAQPTQKRTLQQRTSTIPQTTQVMKRAKLSDPLDAAESAQVQGVQIVQQIPQAQQRVVSSEPEYVEMPIETINPKAEPDYGDDPSEVEAIDAENEQEQALAEQEAAEHDQEADDSAHYVEDETYGDMSKYDETYFTEGDDAKAGASGYGSESYAEGGAAADQAAQDTRIQRIKMIDVQLELEHLSQRFVEQPLSVDEEDLTKIRVLRKELKLLDDEFRTLSKATSSEAAPLVSGFQFPIANEDDLERLETAVKMDPSIRSQYIYYLSVVKPLRLTIVQTFGKFFTDQAMTNYNWHGLERAEYPRTPKKAMQKYEIFPVCMLEAWESHGIDHDQLVEQLKKTVYHICRRRYTKKQALKKRYRTTEFQE